jgi:hypothetical protein
MNALDELTLKLLTSKKKYNNYLANAMPDKSAEVRCFYDKIAKFRPRIQTLLGKYLDDPATQTTNELDDAVEQCLRAAVKHLEMRDYEDKCARKGYDETDSSEEEEVLFQTPDFQTPDVQTHDDTETLIPNTSSFWGGRVNKQQSSLDSFVRRRPKPNTK